MNVTTLTQPIPMSEAELALIDELRAKFMASRNRRFHHYDTLYDAVETLRSPICDTDNQYTIEITYQEVTCSKVARIVVKVEYEQKELEGGRNDVD